MRQVIGDGDGHQGEDEPARHLDHRPGAGGSQLGGPGEDQVNRQEQGGEQHQHDAAQHRLQVEAEIVHRADQRVQGGARGDTAQQRAPDRGFLEAVEGHRGQQGEHEGGHRQAAGRGGDQRRRVGPQVERPAPGRPGRVLATAKRRKLSKHVEGQCKRLAAGQPGAAAEQPHAGPGDQRIGGDGPGQRRRGAGLGGDQLEPGEGDEQRHRRPGAEPGGIGEVQAEGPAAACPPPGGLGPLEEDRPGIDQRPGVADQRRQVGEADPPDDPDEARREIADGFGVAEPARRQHQGEQPDRDEPEAARHPGMQQGAHRGQRRQIGAAQRLFAGPPAEGQRHHHEAQRHRGPGAHQVEVEGQRQVVARAEGVRPGGGRAQQPGGHRRQDGGHASAQARAVAAPSGGRSR